MSPGEFLRAVWPDRGYYCIVWPFTPPDDPSRTIFAHKVFDDVSSAASYALQHRNTKDVYYAVLSLREREIFDPTKIDPRTGELGAKAVRKQSNMLAGKAFFFDIDIDLDDPKKYDNQGQAIVALKNFVQETQLPKPTLVSSGGGLHVYWIIENSLQAENWKTPALQLKQLAIRHGLRIDPSRTTDTASILRVPGTNNLKHPDNPRPVDVMHKGPVTPTKTLTKAISDACVRSGVELKQAPSFNGASSLLGSNTTREYDGHPVHIKDLGNACAQMRLLLKTRGNVDQSAWYHGILNVVKYTRSDTHSGRQLAHLFSQGHPQYDADETNAKLDQLEQSINAPSRCATIAEYSPWGEDPCTGCPFANDASVPNPLVGARRTAKAPAPIAQEYLLGVQVNIEIPDPPAPYIRMKDGGVSMVGKAANGDERVEMIYPYDIYPLRRMINPELGVEQQMWRVELPRAGKQDFLLDADALYDVRKFVVAIANQGIYPHKSHIAHLQDYMVAYISELQRLADADSQSNHLGWADEHRKFILPDKILHEDGSVKPSMLSLGAQRSSAQIYKRGDLATQVATLKFYEHPAYIPNQFFILASLAAPLYYATGHHGIVINASGEAGSSKSTTLYTAASLWGNPELYPINGTNNGATMRGRNERVNTLANLPVCVDEITHMPIKDAVDLAMSITQPGHRIRLQTDGVERTGTGAYKATIMLTTANNSLHGLLSTDNSAGTAGSMRVFEIAFKPTHVHTKAEADIYWRALRDNFGHIGEIFIAHVIRNRFAIERRIHEKIRKIDMLIDTKASERFWSAVIAVILVAGEIAVELGLVSYNIAAIEHWLVTKQVPYMRGIIVSEYADPLSVLADYMEKINSNIIVTERIKQLSGAFANSASVVIEPRGALLGHYDLDTRVMYILKSSFKEHCQQTGANVQAIVRALAETDPAGRRIVVEERVRRTLGAGTKFAKAQSWCFAIDMKHQAVSGAVKLESVGNTNPKIQNQDAA